MHTDPPNHVGGPAAQPAFDFTHAAAMRRQREAATQGGAQAKQGSGTPAPYGRGAGTQGYSLQPVMNHDALEQQRVLYTAVVNAFESAGLCTMHTPREELVQNGLATLVLFRCKHDLVEASLSSSGGMALVKVVRNQGALAPGKPTPSMSQPLAGVAMPVALRVEKYVETTADGTFGLRNEDLLLGNLNDHILTHLSLTATHTSPAKTKGRLLPKATRGVLSVLSVVRSLLPLPAYMRGNLHVACVAVAAGVAMLWWNKRRLRS